MSTHLQLESDQAWTNQAWAINQTDVFAPEDSLEVFSLIAQVSRFFNPVR